MTKYLNLLQWSSYLPGVVKTRYLNAIIHDKQVNNNTRRKSLKSALKSFNWDKSRDGKKYWKNIVRDLENIKIDPYALRKFYTTELHIPGGDVENFLDRKIIAPPNTKFTSVVYNSEIIFLGTSISMFEYNQNSRQIDYFVHLHPTTETFYYNEYDSQYVGIIKIKKRLYHVLITKYNDK